MIKVNKPNFIEYKQCQIIEACTYNMRNGVRLNNILSSKNSIVQASLNYDQLANQGKLSTISTHNSVSGGATKDDMVWLYDAKFVQDGGRKYYNKIMLLPTNGICPMCGKRTVSTLDHYLPKTKYPTYAVTAFNLLASCSECNKVKLTKTIASREEETIHPYYDDFNDEVWLKAVIIEEFPIGFIFTVYKPDTWIDEKFKRAKNHFATFRLSSLYSAHAADIFSSYKIQLKRLYRRRGIEAIREDLEDRMVSNREVRLNSWEAAVYAALLNSSWFFDTYIPAEMS
ncbi:hypothetical protein J2Z44_001298 [Clostridium punense]|uniref:HNH endonuclease n=1 Tax=Clostridium punense TaxID=1054297 RepID=A0ABS4K145_9CLOT|nr:MULTISPECIES: hypothetical protein [Clostridium]EQB87921.1 hypothetical protein M918_06780 [Clostridium sp. BL8]MBP2021502.1 hypothetical protein [Clostridium punense]